MGYGSYITNTGKEAGYLVDAVCEWGSCGVEIHRGMAYACGGEPGEYEDYCDGYFCYDHLEYTDSPHGYSSLRCPECAERIRQEMRQTPSDF